MVRSISPNNPYKGLTDGSAEQWEAERAVPSPPKPPAIAGLNEVIDGARATDEIITEVRRFLVAHMQSTMKHGAEAYPREMRRVDWRLAFKSYLSTDL